MRAIGRVLLSAIRKCDLAIRWGGEELLVALPHTDEDGGLVLAERIRKQIEHLEIEGLTRVTISAGVATLASDGSALTAIADADRRLYEAKARGRNRVV